MDLINKDELKKVCKEYKITKIEDAAIDCIETYLSEILTRQITQQILTKDECDQPVEQPKKKKRRNRGKDSSK